MSKAFASWDDRATQRGMVLVIVLWIVTLLAVMAGGFAYSMRIETRLATSAVERAQDRALAEAGVAYALAWQLAQKEDIQKKWPPNSDPHDWMFAGGRLRIQVTDANGLVSLNSADTELLKALLAGSGVESGEQEHVVEAILDWREPDRQRSLRGGQTVGLPTARSGEEQAGFESIEDLQQVAGISQQVYERLAGMVTVFSYHSGINPELAPAGLLQTLGLDERSVADYVTARARAAADGLPTPSLPPTSGQFFVPGGESNVYHISVLAETGAGTAVKVDAVASTQIMISFGIDRKPRLLAWREGR